MERDGYDWTVTIWLVAVQEPVAPEEVRRFWKVEETPVLDAIIQRSPAIRLGTTEVTLPDNADRRGPVGRVFDVLVYRGTVPGFVLPRVDDVLTAELVSSIRSRPTDPTFDALAPDALHAFLLEHRGERLATREQPGYVP